MRIILPVSCLVLIAASASAQLAPNKVDTPRYAYVENMPEPSFDVSRYIGENLKYPQSAKERNVQGKVVVKFEVNEAGDVVNARIAQGLDAECDSEALRVIQNMPRWKPGKQNGKPVKVTFTLPLEFMLKTQNGAHD